jgi:exonuclease SbcC
MKITINNFRCFRTPLEINIEDGKLYLLKGQSGAGKTTIFESIRWGFFGSMRNIYPIGFTPAYGGSSVSQNKTYVKIEHKNITIVRSQAPEQLRVQTDEIELTQEAAQRYIDSILGNKNIWAASSFIRQNERCPLMSANNTERMALLNETLFGSDNTSEFENPDYYLEKLEEQLSISDKEITASTAVFNSHYTKYVENLKNFTNPYGWSEMSEKFIKSIEESIAELRNKITNLSNTLIEVSKLEERKKLLEEKLLKCKIDKSSQLIDTELKIQRESKERSSKLILECKSNLSKAITLQARFTTLMEELSSSEKAPELNTVAGLKPDLSSIELQVKIKELKERLLKVKTDENALFQYQQNLSNLKEELSNTENEYNQYICRHNDIKDIEMLRKILNNTNVYKKIHELHTSISELRIDNTTLISENKISEEREQITSKYHSSLFLEKLFKKYNIDASYSVAEKRQSYITAISKNTVQKEQLLLKEQVNTIKKEIDSLSCQKTTINTELSEIQIDEKIKSIEQKIGAPLKCPHCDCTVEFKNNTLIKANEEMISKEEGLRQINELKMSKNAIVFNRNIDTKIDNLNIKGQMIVYDEMICNEQIIEPSTIETMKSFITDFQSYENNVYENSSELQDKLTLLSRMERYHQLVKEYTILSGSYDATIGIDNNIDSLQQSIIRIPTLESRIQILNNKITDINIKIKSINLIDSSENIQNQIDSNTSLYNNVIAYELALQKVERLKQEICKIDLSTYDINSLQTQLEESERELDELNNSIISLTSMYSKAIEYEETIRQLTEIIICESQETIAQTLETSQDRYNDLLTQHSQARFMLELLSNKSELETLQVKLMSLTTKQLSLNKIKAVIVDVTNSALQDLVDNINTITNNVLEELFDCGISIELKLYKEIKNKNKTKPYVNIVVTKDGEDFDILALSGGERDRVSLALTVAMSSLHISPIVFIDEGLSALDEDRKESCIDIIRKYLIPQKTVCLIEHSGNSAHYCDVIALGCC